jgi:hypothetical protein
MVVSAQAQTFVDMIGPLALCAWTPRFCRSRCAITWPVVSFNRHANYCAVNTVLIYRNARSSLLM